MDDTFLEMFEMEIVEKRGLVAICAMCWFPVILARRYKRNIEARDVLDNNQ